MKNKKKGYDKILDAWIPPKDCGEPVGCMATSFTFSPVFFEEECLSRFLQLGTDATEDGALYLIEREEKLAGVSCAAALIDQHHCRGSRNLRWDLLSVRIPKGIFHAKVALLHWNNLIRLIVTSANLTEDGYRRNQEIFGVLDYKLNSKTPLTCLTETVNFLKKSVYYTTVNSKMPAVNRLNAFLENVLTKSQNWGSIDNPKSRKEVRVNVLFSEPDSPTILEDLKNIWPDNSPPNEAIITSPFFDSPDAINHPAHKIWDVLKQRGKADVTYNVTAEEDETNKDSLIIHAPESLVKAKPLNRNVSIQLKRVSEGEMKNRPLHLKSILIKNNHWDVYLIGSSNFTSKGLGISKYPNFEANLAYSVCNEDNSEALNRIKASYLNGNKINQDLELKWESNQDENEDSPNDIVLLPASFENAIFGIDEKIKAYVEFTFSDHSPPSGWKIQYEDHSTIFYNEGEWKKQGCPLDIKLPWHDNRPPAGFNVYWKDSNGLAYWPVNIESAEALPPPDDLKDLPLDVLINILTSSRPLHISIRSWLKRKNNQDKTHIEVGEIIDPHKRVDTSTFLLQRTRRVSMALTALRMRLERPVPTIESLLWRLRGPIGIIELSRAIAKEAQSSEERLFLITELALELAHVNPQEAQGCLEPSKVKEEIKKVIEELRNEVHFETLENLPNMEEYIKSSFEVATK